MQICISSQVANKKTQDFKHFQYMILESIPLSSPSRQRVGLVNHSKADDWKSFMFNRKITFSKCTGRIHYLLCLNTTYPKRGRKPWIRCIQNGCASHHASRAHTKATRLLEKTTQWWSPGRFSSIGCKMESLAPKKIHKSQKHPETIISKRIYTLWHVLVAKLYRNFLRGESSQNLASAETSPRCIFFCVVDSRLKKATI